MGNYGTKISDSGILKYIYVHQTQDTAMVFGDREMRKVGNERVRDALLYLERIMRDRCIKSRVAAYSRRQSRTRTCTRVYKYLPTNSHLCEIL